MEDIRTYREDDSQQWPIPDDEPAEWGAASSSDDEVPFHIPRD
jgi:hypothetical protein